jgi:hypothetical protein
VTIDMAPEVWRRRQRLRKVLVAGTVAAGLAGATAAFLYAEPHAQRRRLASDSADPSGAPSAATSAPSYPDPFLKMTPAGIEAAWALR